MCIPFTIVKNEAEIMKKKLKWLIFVLQITNWRMSRLKEWFRKSFKYYRNQNISVSMPLTVTS